MHKWVVITLCAGSALAASGGASLAHHSFAMFDQEHPIEVEGVVQEFRFSAPHTFLMLDVKTKDGGSDVWALEGGAPSALVRNGWTPSSLQPGDEVTLTVAPLRSGVSGGWWSFEKIKFRDGHAIVVHP